eukprot:g7461.t1
MDVSDRLHATTTECFAAKSKFEAESEAQGIASDPALSSPLKKTPGHKSTVQVEPTEESLASYKVGKASPSSPLRIVRHEITHAREQKHNPDQTHRGRIRNTSGGFYNS